MMRYRFHETTSLLWLIEDFQHDYLQWYGPSDQQDHLDLFMWASVAWAEIAKLRNGQEVRDFHTLTRTVTLSKANFLKILKLECDPEMILAALYVARVYWDCLTRQKTAIELQHGGAAYDDVQRAINEAEQAEHSWARFQKRMPVDAMTIFKATFGKTRLAK